MNYRHAFHAGNFADLVKHACLTELIGRLKSAGGPLQVLDTHAGAGVYDLGGEMARKSGEGAAAVALMADAAAPAVFAPLKTAVAALNPQGGARLYPGSPVIVAGLLERGDRYLGCELRPDDVTLLQQALKAHAGRGDARGAPADGYAEAARLKAGPGRRLVLIDPPYERADEYEQVVRATRQALRGDPAICVAIWAPLKDLDTFDRFIGRLEDLQPPPTLVAEARLRELHDPLKMNGCAMVVVGAPAGLDEAISPACQWVVGHLGQAGGKVRLWQVGGG
jgi:23S rRNA (adenine2030-N6)-methyltransferase